VLASGLLGQLNGLPVTVIVSITLQELESGAGQAVTATGTLLAMSTLIRMASNAHHYLVIFDKHIGRTLDLGRTRRIASADQRIVLHAKDRGCTRPGCTVAGAYAKSITQTGIGPTTDKPTSTTSPWPVQETTAKPNPVAGEPAPAGRSRRSAAVSAALGPVHPGMCARLVA